MFLTKKKTFSPIFIFKFLTTFLGVICIFILNNNLKNDKTNKINAYYCENMFLYGYKKGFVMYFHYKNATFNNYRLN